MNDLPTWLSSNPGYAVLIFCVGIFLCIFIYDVFIQKDKAILHNFPIVGHLRYLMTIIGPEMRQYWVANDKEEQPFNRSEPDWIYESASNGNNTTGFGTSEIIYSVGYPIIKNAVSALNIGAKLAGCYHNSGEGSVSQFHKLGGDIVWQIGTAYFGCRDEDGNFDLNKMIEKTQSTPAIRAIELKMSQGAKPGKSGILPGAKLTPEIAEVRGIPVGETCFSPNNHTAFQKLDLAKHIVWVG